MVFTLALSVGAKPPGHLVHVVNETFCRLKHKLLNVGFGVKLFYSCSKQRQKYGTKHNSEDSLGRSRDWERV